MAEQNLIGYVLTAWDGDTGLPSWPVAYGVGFPGSKTSEFVFRPMPGTPVDLVDPWLECVGGNPEGVIQDVLASFVDASPIHGYVNTQVQGGTVAEALEFLLDDILASFVHTSR